MKPFELSSIALQALVILSALATALAKEAKVKKISFSALLIACTALVCLVFGNTLLNGKREEKATAEMDLGQVEMQMRLYSAMKPYESSVSNAKDMLDKALEESRRSLNQAVRKDGQSLATRFKEGIFVGEEGGKLAPVLDALGKLPDKKAAEAVKTIEDLYIHKHLAPADLPARIKFVEETLPRGWFREVSEIEAYKVSHEEKKFQSALLAYENNAQHYGVKFVALICYVFFSVIIGLFVLLVQLFLLQRALSKDKGSEEILAPQDWGWAKVYGVFVGWLALECISAPLVMELAKLLKGALGKEPAVIALLAMAIYLLNNVPALLIAWFCVIRPSGNKFWESVKLRFQTPRRGPFGLVMAGVLTWYGCLPLVIVGSLVAKVYLSSEGSSNPILPVVQNAVRSGDIWASVLFIFALGVLPGICEETLFRGFLYTFLRRKMGAFLSIVLSAAFFAGVHLDKGAFLPLFILGFGFAYTFERTRSLVPCMVAHCMWNSGTFLVMMILYG